MCTEQLSFLTGDLASQRAFLLGALIEDALRLLRSLPARPEPADRLLEEQALTLIYEASIELRALPQEGPVPF